METLPLPTGAIQTHIATTSKLLQLFCAQNGRAMLTKAEREQLLHFDSEIARVEKHGEKFATGLARKKLGAARGAYVSNPSDENRAALDKVRATWLEEDSENQAQRVIIRRVLAGMATEKMKQLIPLILRRAANALAWLAVQVQFDEEAKHKAFEVPFRPSGIMEALVNRLSFLRMIAQRIDSTVFTWNGRPGSYQECEWLADLAKIEGEVWNADTLDPDAKRSALHWRNIGQLENPLFQPLLCGAITAATPATSEKGTAVKKYAAPSAAAA